ncbi:MAG TPA: MFS transporter [Terriglobia bacterium]|nr:MFS transporter [Terriglobia bacterium]
MHTEENLKTARHGQHWAISAGAVILAMMSIQMSSLGFSPLQPAMQEDLAASYSQMGLFAGMYGIIALIVSLPAGILAARIGEKRALLGGLAITAIGLVSLGNAVTFSGALASRALWLVGYRVAFISVFTSMAIVTPAQYRSRTMGVLGAMAALASVIGAPFGTHLAGLLGWRGGIFGFAGIAVVGGALFAALYRPGHSSESTGVGPHGHPVTAIAVSALRSPIIWGMMLLGLINMGGFSVTFFVPYAVRTVFGLADRESAQIISVAYAVAMFLNLGVGYLCDRFSRWNMMIVVAILLIPSSFAVMSRDLAIFQIAVALIVSLGHAATNQMYAIGSLVLPRNEVGKGMGVVALGGGVFGFLGPQMLGYLRDATGGFTAGWLFVSVAAMLSLADLLALRAYSLRSRSAEAASG